MGKREYSYKTYIITLQYYDIFKNAQNNSSLIFDILHRLSLFNRLHKLVTISIIQIIPNLYSFENLSQ